jgi:hypothetical protein
MTVPCQQSSQTHEAVRLTLSWTRAQCDDHDHRAKEFTALIGFEQRAKPMLARISIDRAGLHCDVDGWA